MSSLNEKNVPAKALMKYVPEGHSPKLYIEMAKHIMGTDQNGNARPFEDLLIFLMTAKRTGLDPMAKQIYPIYRWDSRIGAEKMTIQAGIDGLRATAQKTNLYGGSGDAMFEEKDSKPVKATVTVFKINEKTGSLMPTTATARYSEYVQVNKKGEEMGLWKKMPYNQLAKCAEALALRKAFPNDLSGVYSEDEMSQANTLDLPAPEVVAGKSSGGTNGGSTGTKPAQPGTSVEDAEIVQQPKVTVTPAQKVKNDATFKAVAKDGAEKVEVLKARTDEKISDIRAKLKIKGEIERLKADIKLYDAEIAKYEANPADTDKFRAGLADEKKKQEARRAKLAELEGQV